MRFQIRQKQRVRTENKIYFREHFRKFLEILRIGKEIAYIQVFPAPNRVMRTNHNALAVVFMRHGFRKFVHLKIAGNHAVSALDYLRLFKVFEIALGFQRAFPHIVIKRRRYYFVPELQRGEAVTRIHGQNVFVEKIFDVMERMNEMFIRIAEKHNAELVAEFFVFVVFFIVRADNPVAVLLGKGFHSLVV